VRQWHVGEMSGLEGSRCRWIGREGGIEKWGRESEFESPWDGKEEATETSVCESVLRRVTVSMIVGVTTHFSLLTRHGLAYAFNQSWTRDTSFDGHSKSNTTIMIWVLFFLNKYRWC